MSTLDLKIQGQAYADSQQNLRNMIHINKQVNASGGFKIPQESIDRRTHRNKYATGQLGQDIPTKEELFEALGVAPVSRLERNDPTNQSRLDRNQITTSNIDNQIEKQRQAMKPVKEKYFETRLQGTSPNREEWYDKHSDKVYDMNPDQKLVNQTSSADMDHMIEQHRKSMKPLEDQYFESRLSQERFNPRRPFAGDLTQIDEGMEHSKLQQSQSDSYFVKQRQQSAKVRVTYHDRTPSPSSSQKPNIGKMRRIQRDYSGPHGNFLQKVMPEPKLREVRSQSNFVKEEDFQIKFKQYLRQKRATLDVDHLKRNTKDSRSGRQFGSESPKDRRSRDSKKKSKSSKDEELFLIQHFFKEIDKSNLGKVDKIQTIKYLMQSTQILEAFDIEPSHLNKLISHFKTKDPSSFKLQEFASFLQKQKKANAQHSGHEVYGSLGKVSGVIDFIFLNDNNSLIFSNDKTVLQMKKATQSGQKLDLDAYEFKTTKNSLYSHHASSCLLTKEQISSLKAVFDHLDRNGDSIVPRLQYIQELRNDINIVRILHIQACYVASIDKIQTLDKVLSLVEQSYYSADDKESMSFISWYQFMEFMNTDGQRPIAKSKIAFAQLHSSVQDNIDDQDNIDVSKKFVKMIHEQFELLDKHEKLYASTQDITEAIRRHPLYSDQRKEICRNKAKKYNLATETLEEVICRMEEEAPEFMALHEVMCYFTRRGTPKFLESNYEGGDGDDDDMLESIAKSINVTDNNFNPQNSIKRGNRLQQPPQREIIDGYNSIIRGNRLQSPQQRHIIDGQISIKRGKRSQSPPQREIIDGYDSDPEIHTYQDKLLPRQRFGRQKSVQAHQTYTHRSSKSASKQQDLTKTGKSNLSMVESQSFAYSSKQDFLNSIQPSRGKFGAHHKPSDYLYTVTRPEPYLFDGQEKERSQSTRQRKLQKSYDEKNDQNIKLADRQFRAKDVPKHVKDNLYEKILEANESRRLQVKKDSVAITLQNEKPFSFYYRDKIKEVEQEVDIDSKPKPKKKKYWERDKFIFKAKQIPWHVHVNLWKQMQEDEENTRKERVAKHAQQLAMQSKMPARMEKHERLKQAQQLDGHDPHEQAKNKFYQHSHRPQSSKKMPDFERLHTNFQDKLERKKQQMRTTEAVPFVFSKSHKGTTREYLDNENIMTKMTNMPLAVDPIEDARKNMSRKPKIQPGSTKKYTANLEFLKKEREQKREQQEQIKKEDLMRLEKKDKFKSRVQHSKAIQDNTKKLKEQGQRRKDDFKQQSKDQEARFKLWKADRLSNAANQPLLVERPTKRDTQLEKMKALHKFNKILDANKVTNKHEFLNEDEKILLQDMDHLKKNGYGSEFDDESDEDVSK